MKVLITGAGGFIGSHLAKALIERDYKVRGLFLPLETVNHAEKLGIEIVRGDLTKLETLRGVTDGIDTVYHLATRTLDWGTKKQFESVMVHGTKNLLIEACGKIKRFIYFSSIAALGFGRDTAGLNEGDEQVKTGIPYCDTKISAEKIVRDFCKSNDIDFTIIRPANVMGPGSVWVREVLDAYLRAPFPLISKGNTPGAFVYIDNLIEGSILAAESEKAIGKTYHLRDDYSATWGDYLKELGSLIGKKPFSSLSFKLAWFMGWFFELFLTPFGIRPPVSRLAAAVFGKNNNVDNSLAKKDLGWTTRISYTEGMKSISEWVKTHYKAPLSKGSKDYYNRVVYITGGSSGIGLEIAKLMAQKGAHIMIMARSQKQLDEARSIVESKRRHFHQNIQTLSMDVSLPDDVAKKIEQAIKLIGIPDIVINSAGIIAADHFENISYNSFDKVMKINVYGTWSVIQNLLPMMRERGGGRFVLISSAAGLMGMYGYSCYSASKFAIVGFSECLRSEMKKYNINVTVVCPPDVKTPMVLKEAETIPPEALAVKKLAGSLKPEYVARVVIKGMSNNKYMIIPGLMAKIAYYSQIYLGGWSSRAIADWIIKRERKRIIKD
ncbi:MAG: SDR family NAD(P)-dependent oxidoreductase [Desulfobacterales bacterium]|nr:SDR family NAD(P)-dependent oxidoreductase [Desulfobacterales bacterium]MBF0397849.1 SDR family NAD(P)-dependent oxidoreductase [Desulfobacterales bacterium]